MMYFKRHILCAAPLAFIRLQPLNQAVAPIILNHSCYYIGIAAFYFGIPAEPIIVEQHLSNLAAYTVILCFSLFKSGALAKSIFSAH